MPQAFSIEALESRTLMASVAIDVNDTAQTILGIGGNYTQAHFRNYARDAVGDYNLKNLDPKYVRVGIPVIDWEPVNDDASADTFTWAGFKDSGKITTLFKMIKEFNDAGRIVTASVFDLPDWMISNPEKENQRLVKPGYFPEVAESIAAFVKRAKDVYGATIQFLGFNEVDGGYDVRLTAQENADIIELTGKKLDGLGFSPKWLVGDTYRVEGTVTYAKAILDDAGAAPYLGPIAYHSWWSEKLPESEWRALRTLADQYGKELWCDEMHHYALAQPASFPTWDSARRTALIVAKVIKWAETDVLMYWQYQNDFPLMTADTTDQYYSYYVVKAFVDNLKPGSQIVGANSDTSTVFSLAGKDVARNHFMTMAINTSTAAQQVTYTGLPNEALTLTRNSAGGENVVVGTFTPVNGTLTLTLEADSVNTLAGKLGTVVVPPPPPPPGPVTLQAKADAYVHDGTSATTNFGQSGELQLKHSSTTGYRRETLLQFDLASIPSVGKATLRLFGGLTDTRSMNIPLAVYKAANATWSENAVTWNTRPGVVGSAVATKTITDATARWYELDLTNLVKSEKAAGATTLSLVVRATQSSTPYLRFQSAEGGASGPQLLIDPTVTPPAPGPTVLSASDDAYVRDGTSAATNFGQASELQLKHSSTAGYRRETLLKFNLSTVSTINSARLRLFGRLSDATAANIQTAIYKAASTLWTENGVTWNTKPAVSGVAQATVTITDATARWYEFDLTALMKAEKAAGRNLVGLVLRNLQSSNTYTLFNSGEAALNQPQLVIT